jgi:hypothetical protein
MRQKLYESETVLIRRRVRATGTHVSLIYSWDADPDQPWETVCEEHGGVCSHQSRAVATSFMSCPDEWCEDCMYGEGTLSGEKEAE